MTNPFKTFWMGGFECADQQNAFGNRVDLAVQTGHLDHAEEDYRKLAALGIFTIREGIRWSAVEKVPYQYNFRDAENLITAAENTGMQIVWDICHFGFPDDLTPLHPMFARRFSHLCAAFVEFLLERLPGREIIIVPINEASFLSWLGGEVRGTSPYTRGQGWDVKYHLMKAYIEGVRMIKNLHPAIRVLSSEPLVHIAPLDYSDPRSVLEAKARHEDQFQVLDILCGRICPELGGSPELLDFVGLNFYYNNQWINETHEFLPWAEEPQNPYWKNLSSLLLEVFVRYGKPLLITETGHPKEDRPLWLRHIIREIEVAQRQGLPLLGCCLYPVIDRPDWDFPDQWHHSGIWDIHNPQTLERIPYEPLLNLLRSHLSKS